MNWIPTVHNIAAQHGPGALLWVMALSGRFNFNAENNT